MKIFIEICDRIVKRRKLDPSKTYIIHKGKCYELGKTARTLIEFDDIGSFNVDRGYIEEVK
jgi:hypothetical protein